MFYTGNIRNSNPFNRYQIMHMTQVLAVENATLKFRDKILFTGLNLTINKGEHWAIVGESGSGKSALLQLLAGRGFLSTGSISNYYYNEYLGIHPVSDPLFSHRNLVSFVRAGNDLMGGGIQRFFYQQRYNAGFSDNTETVEDYFKEISGMDKPSGKWDIGSVYETFNLSPLHKKHLSKLSNGESKRVRIGAALLKNPLLLLLDNPLSGLDFDTRVKFEAIFSRIAQSGITIVMVTNPDEIPKVITHVAIAEKNRKLNILKKNEFNPVQWEADTPDVPDARKIRQLLRQREILDSEVLVSMKNVRVAYGESLIFDNINWEIKQGERWALSGPNGSGKSTLLGLINGDHPQAYANEISLFGRRRGTGETIWDIKKRIGFMSPELELYFPDNYACIQVVESGFFDTIGLFSKATEENRQIAEQWMEIMGLPEHKERYLYEVSNSEKRLCLLARSLVKNPCLLLLDEPCTGLDTSQQKHFKNIIDTMASLSNIAIIYVTHHRETLPDCITGILEL